MELGNLSLKCMVNKKMCRSISERLYVAWLVLSRHCVKLWLECSSICKITTPLTALCSLLICIYQNNLFTVWSHLDVCFFIYLQFLKGLLMRLLICIVCAVAVSHCCSHSKSCGFVMKLQGLSSNLCCSA